MSKYSIDNTTLTAIADAIREKGGTSDPILAEGMAAAIAGIKEMGEYLTGTFVTAEDETEHMLDVDKEININIYVVIALDGAESGRGTRILVSGKNNEGKYITVTWYGWPEYTWHTTGENSQTGRWEVYEDNLTEKMKLRLESSVSSSVRSWFLAGVTYAYFLGRIGE